MKEQLFKPSSSLTFDTVQQDSERLLKMFRDNKTASIRVDLGGVTDCDSAGLALLIEAKRLGIQYHKPLIIEGLTKATFTLAEFCGVEAMLEQ